MIRQLQVKDGVAKSEWTGAGAVPVPPDETWTFVDVTDRPDAQILMLYDAGTDTFSPPPLAPPAAAFPDPIETRLGAIEKALDKLIRKGVA